MEQRAWKIVFIILLAAVLIVLLMNLRGRRDDGIDVAIRKLDSAKLLLDSMRARVDSSRVHLGELATKVNSYDFFLNSISSNVGRLNYGFEKSQIDFKATADKAKKRYQQTKDSVMQYNRSNWPEIIIDSSR